MAAHRDGLRGGGDGGVDERTDVVRPGGEVGRGVGTRVSGAAPCSNLTTRSSEISAPHSPQSHLATLAAPLSGPSSGAGRLLPPAEGSAAAGSCVIHAGIVALRPLPPPPPPCIAVALSAGLLLSPKCSHARAAAPAGAAMRLLAFASSAAGVGRPMKKARGGT